LLEIADTAICFIFLWDFFYRLYRAPNRAAFMKWGWVDFISSIPMLGVFRWGRLVRVIRILRILRGIRSTKVILNVLFEHRAKGALTVVALISAVLIIFSSIAILNAEAVPEANIKTGGDALWWAVTTVTTVGYGDKFPVTAAGRIIAALLMFTGVGLFGTFTGFIASFFLDPRKQGQTEDSDLLKEVRLLREKLEGLEGKLSHAQITLPAQFGPSRSKGILPPGATAG
jgi:voltage-gated potassium channel